MELLKIDFAALFHLKTPVAELIIRGALMYLGILLLLRVLPRRTGGELAMMDLIFVILIAEAATHSLGGYKSITEGFIVIATLMLLNYSVNWLSFRVKFIEKIFSAPAIHIIKDGRLIRRNMRREYITEEELHESLRKEHIEHVEQVKVAYVEGDGRISIIRKD